VTRASGPIEALVAGASRRALHAVIGQALCLALGTYGVTLALALLGGAELTVIGAHVAAATAALAAGAAWRANHPIDERRLVRRADVALDLRGAFEAAVEEEARAPGGTFASLTAQRLFRAARPRELCAAAEPNAVPFAAVPLAAAVLLAVAATLALERRPRGSAVHELAFLAADDLAAAMEQAVRQGSITTEELRDLAAVTAEARLLGASLAGSGVSGAIDPGSGGAPSPGGGAQRASAEGADGDRPSGGADPAGEAVDVSQGGAATGGPSAATSEGIAGDLARRVDALAAELGGASDSVRAALERAALALDTLSLGRDLEGTSDPMSGRESGEPVTAASGSAMMEGSHATDVTGERAAKGPRDAAASGANPPPTGAGDPHLGDSRAAEERGAPEPLPDAPAQRATAAPAVAAGRPWPERYDALAERWSRDHARAAATSNPSPTDKQ
jgi:hypothetical protein